MRLPARSSRCRPVPRWRGRGAQQKEAVREEEDGQHEAADGHAERGGGRRESGGIGCHGGSVKHDRLNIAKVVCRVWKCRGPPEAADHEWADAGRMANPQKERIW